jgi:hypothetical protein
MIRLHLIFVALMAAVSALTLSGADRPQHNFLFVVDSSLSMTQHKAAAIKLVRNVIASKFDDQIEPGDSIDVWTYDTENNLLGFPPQIWQPTDAARISDAIAEYLGKYRFKGSSDFGQVATDLTMLVPQTKGMLIVVITDGEKPFSGINRDLEINEYLSKKGKLGASNGPLLVSLAAINGDIRTWTTYFGTGVVDLATLPERTKRTATVAQTKPQAPPKAQPVQKPAPKAQHPPIPSTPIEGQQFVFNFPPGARVTPLDTPANKSTRLDKPFDISDAIKNVRATNPAPTLAELAASILAKKAANSNAPIANAVVPTNRTIVQTADSAKPATVPSGTNAAKSLLVAEAKAPETNRPAVTNVALVVSTNKTTNVAMVAAKIDTVISNAPNESVSKPVVASTVPKVSATSSTNINHPGTWRRAMYVSAITGVCCVGMGILLVIRKFRRPSQSIISRSLLQR